MMPKSVESVFIFQEGCEGEANAAVPTYDAIVVEQWTIIDVSGAAAVFIQASSGKDARFSFCFVFQRWRTLNRLTLRFMIQNKTFKVRCGTVSLI